MRRTRVMRNGYLAYAGTDNEYVHVAVAEKALGRKLPPKAVVHHINEDKLDNHPENLVICPDQTYHLLLHARARVVDAGGNPNTQKICGCCKQLLSKDAFSFKASWDGRAGECRSCTNQRRFGKCYTTLARHRRAA